MSAQQTSGPLPFYPLNVDFEPMYCICDHGGPETDDWCKKCPHRAIHKEAASAEVQARREVFIAKAAAPAPADPWNNGQPLDPLDNLHPRAEGGAS